MTFLLDNYTIYCFKITSISEQQQQQHKKNISHPYFPSFNVYKTFNYIQHEELHSALQTKSSSHGIHFPHISSSFYVMISFRYDGLQSLRLSWWDGSSAMDEKRY
jgi:hypothetical protein